MMSCFNKALAYSVHGFSTVPGLRYWSEYLGNIIIKKIVRNEWPLRHSHKPLLSLLSRYEMICLTVAFESINRAYLRVKCGYMLFINIRQVLSLAE